MRRFYPIRKGSPSAAAESRSPDASWSITIPCYEGPEGNGPGCLSLTNDAFARHVFVAGATGAGKSTLLRSILRQLIALGAENAARKPSILVFDFKEDDTTAFVQAAATAAGRKDDVEVLSLNSPVGYDFFRDCRSLADVTEYVQRLTFASGRVDSKDNFWDQYRDGLLHAALIWLVVAHSNRRDFSTWIQHAAGWLLSENGLPEEFRNDLAEFRERSEALPVGSADRIVTQQALRQIEEWDRGMDHRTRANAKSTLQLALRPLLEPAVLQIFGRAPERSFRIADAVEHGRILVLSVNAFLHPELAALIGRCAKADWYRAVFARRDCSRHATLVADEFHLCTTSGNARYDDCLALPLLRSRNAGVIAATQTLAGLDRAVGVVNRRVLLGNFGTVFFMRATESEIEEWAQQVCGSVDVEESEREEVQDTRLSGDLGERYIRRVTRRVQRPVCVPGALSRLETGQAYLLQEGGIPSRGPIWIAQDR